MRKSGVIRTCGGSRLPAVNRISSPMLNLKLRRDTMKATADARSSVTATAGTVMRAEFSKNLSMSDWVQALVKFAVVKPPWGSDMYPNLLVEDCGRKAT